MATHAHTSRRQVLKALPALVAPTAAPAGPPPGDTPILRLFRKRRALVQAARLQPPSSPVSALRPGFST